TDDAIYFLGEIAYRQGQYAEALRMYQYLLEKFLASNLYLSAQVQVGFCYYRLGFYDKTTEVLEPLLPRLTEPRQRWAVRKALALATAQRGERLQAAAGWMAALGEAPTEADRTAARQAVKELLATMTNRELLQVIDTYSTDFPRARARFQLGLNYFNTGRFKEARQTLLGFLFDHPTHPEAPRAKALIASIDKTFTVDTSKVGLILPLTGPESVAGQSVLQGVQLAIAQAGVSPEGRPFRLIIRDSAGEPDRAKAAVARLALEEKVIAIIGPVFSETARAAAAEADRLQVPMVVPFAHAPGIPESSPYVFRNSLTNQAQGAFVARYAVESLGLRRFAILYPDDSYGNDLKTLFTQSVEALGGQVVVQAAYDPQANDFSEPIRTLGGVADEELERLHPDEADGPALTSPVPVAQTAPPIDYDTLFIPGYFDKVGLLAPQLAFYNVVGVTLLGCNGWNSPELLTIGEHYVEGAIFVDGFFAGSSRPPVKTFVENFRLTFGNEPDILAAQAYDAAGLVLRVLDDGAANREQLREGLLTIRDYLGASGTTTMTEVGEAQKELFLLMVRRGTIIQIN
ncbi:MAG: ABC transporter substrate-binding protein, partial [Candidatus Tectimicrobiota bacterium]